MIDPAQTKNREIYDHSDDEVWRRAVYLPVHGGWHFTNIGGRGFLDWLGTQGSLGPRSKVLDLCCGSGAAARYLTEAFGSSVTGLDINSSQIDRARAQSGVAQGHRFFVADATDWQADQTYDLAFALDSLTLIANLVGFFATARRALTPGGQLAIVDVVEGENLSPAMRDFALSEDGAVTLVPAEHLAEAMMRCGFTGVRVESLRTEAVRVFSLIHDSVHNDHGWDDLPAARLAEWRDLSARYLAAFESGQLGYVRIVGQAV